MTEKQRTAQIVNLADRRKPVVPVTRRKVGYEPLEIAATSLMAAASVAYLDGEIAIADSLIATYRGDGFPRWVLIEDQELLAYLDEVNLAKASPGNETSD